MTADGSDKDRALSEIRSDIEVTRQRLAQTLDEIEDRLDVPKRFKKAVAEGRGTVRHHAPGATPRSSTACSAAPRSPWRASAHSMIRGARR